MLVLRAVQEDLCVIGVRCLVCQDLVNCYFYFARLHLRHELLVSVMLYPGISCVCSVNGSVCLVCCVFDSVCELFVETICHTLGRGCYFVAECYGGV